MVCGQKESTVRGSHHMPCAIAQLRARLDHIQRRRHRSRQRAAQAARYKVGAQHLRASRNKSSCTAVQGLREGRNQGTQRDTGKMVCDTVITHAKAHGHDVRI